jgi:adenylate kinase family enzyme
VQTDCRASSARTYDHRHAKKGRIRNEYPRLILFIGPTGAGKSALAESFAERSGSPIVVLDRFQVFPDLGTGTGRQPFARRPGVRKYFLERRDIAAGELSPHDALIRVREVLHDLALENAEVILEGGSTSLLQLLMLDADLTAKISRIERVDLKPDQHIKAIVDRAQQMLVSASPSMIQEADIASRKPSDWRFVSGICGYDAIAAVCSEMNCSPGQIPDEVIGGRILPRLVASHLYYAATQRFTFNMLFSPSSQASRLMSVAMP